MKIALVGSRFRSCGVRGAAQGGRRHVLERRRACGGRPVGARRAGSGAPRARARESQDGARRCGSRGTDLIVAARTHARVSDEALAHSRLGGVGYHPSLLPRHRGIAAVEWTIKEGDPIAGGSVYHLADGWDKGRHRRAGMVLRRARRDGARAVGACAGSHRSGPPPEGGAVRPGARPRA